MRLFLTGGTGFVGRELLPELLRRGHEVRALTRRPARLPSGAVTVTGDLLEPGSYRAALIECDRVVHLAAATGARPPGEHERVNAGGTRALLRAATEQGVRGMIFVSSIAATFPELSHYPYGRSKARAEDAVRAAGLPYLIIRPTQVFGEGSAVLEGLRKLARLPITPLFNGGSARIQPVHVGDLVQSIADLVERDELPCETLDVGGPEIATMKEVLLRLREIEGRRPTTVAVPLAPVLPVVRMLERIAPGRLPVSPGQLSSFRFDGVAGPGAAPADVGAAVGLDAMLQGASP